MLFSARKCTCFFFLQSGRSGHSKISKLIPLNAFFTHTKTAKTQVQELIQKDLRMPILGVWKFLVLITSATFCAQYIEDISSLYHNVKEGRFAGIHGICV